MAYFTLETENAISVSTKELSKYFSIPWMKDELTKRRHLPDSMCTCVGNNKLDRIECPSWNRQTRIACNLEDDAGKKNLVAAWCASMLVSARGCNITVLMGTSSRFDTRNFHAKILEMATILHNFYGHCVLSKSTVFGSNGLRVEFESDYGRHLNTVRIFAQSEINFDTHIASNGILIVLDSFLLSSDVQLRASSFISASPRVCVFVITTADSKDYLYRYTSKLNKKECIVIDEVAEKERNPGPTTRLRKRQKNGSIASE